MHVDRERLHLKWRSSPHSNFNLDWRKFRHPSIFYPVRGLLQPRHCTTFLQTEERQYSHLQRLVYEAVQRQAWHILRATAANHVAWAPAHNKSLTKVRLRWCRSASLRNKVVCL
jgi:hypothetical protein